VPPPAEAIAPPADTPLAAPGAAPDINLVYRFSRSQQRQVDSIFEAFKQMESNLTFFLNYCAGEADLPILPGGYRLSENRRGLVRPPGV
jgi:hypothetical protein